MDFAAQVEDIIDREGVDGLLDVITDVCLYKAEHLATNWQDVEGARKWQNAAIAFQTMKEKTAVRAVMYKGR
jgi:hypothetical protein